MEFMQYVRFRDPAGSIRNGTLEGDLVKFANVSYQIEEIDLLAPVEPSKIICVGKNYADHAAEMDSEVPDSLMLFIKTPNTIADPNTTVTMLGGKERIDHEGELAIIIGQQCRFVSEENAMEVVAGYTAANDLSNRDDQFQEQNWVRGKAFDSSLPLGPAMVDKEDVPENASVVVRVNGEVRQKGSIDQLIYSIPVIIAEITEYITLEQGDVIITGTPAGVGPLEDGDVVEVDIEGIPTLKNTIRIPE